MNLTSMYKYRIESNRLITKNILSLRLKAATEKDIFNFTSGQYVALSFRKDGRSSAMRCFSIASSSEEKGFLEFGVRLTGAFTSELAKLKSGSEIAVMGPYGNLTLDPREVGHAVLIAGGVGITPFLSMIRTSLMQKWPVRIALLYSARSWSEAAYASELVFYGQKNAGFKPFFFLNDASGAKPDQAVINGFITADEISKIVSGCFSDKSFYLCGPPAFMRAIKSILIAKNVSLDKIITEEFSVSKNELGADSPQTKINFYAFLAVLIGFILIMIGDIAKTDKKLASVNLAPIVSTTEISGLRSTTVSSVAQEAASPVQANVRRKKSAAKTPPVPSVSLTPTPVSSGVVYTSPVTGVS